MNIQLTDEQYNLLVDRLCFVLNDTNHSIYNLEQKVKGGMKATEELKDLEEDLEDLTKLKEEYLETQKLLDYITELKG